MAEGLKTWSTPDEASPPADWFDNRQDRPAISLAAATPLDYTAAMNVEREFFDEHDAEATAASVARGEADIAAGRIVPNEAVIEWLKTWGTEKRGPCPREWRQ